jgi:glycosyltransferase involved in cell wall biosynthesis
MNVNRKFNLSDAKSIQGSRYSGNIDGVFGDQLCGWVMNLDTPDAYIPLGLAVDGVIIQTAIASDSRPDLEAAGTGPHAFAFPLDGLASRLEAANSDVATICLLDDPAYYIGHFGYGVTETLRSDARIPAIRKFSVPDFAALEAALDTLESDVGEPLSMAPESTSETAIFTSVERLDIGTAAGAPPLTRYQLFAAQRFLQRFGLERGGEDWDRDRFFDWYLFHYSQMRRGQRVPLSEPQIGYLNGRMTFGRAAFNPTRAMMLAIDKDKSLFASQDYETLSGYEDVCYWWAVETARVLFCEDCLVSDEQISTLARVSRVDDAKRYPLSVFLRLFAERKGLTEFLKLENEQDRTFLYLVAILHAIRRPDIMRYIPSRGVEELFACVEGSRSIFVRYLNAVFVPEGQDEIEVGLDEITEIFAKLGYSLPHRRFCFSRSNGNRMQSLGVPAVRSTRSKLVPVQIIGPISKSSGLGQAARSSAKILEHLGIEHSVHDFDLDDPGTKIWRGLKEAQDLRGARVNLIHLNAESIPLLVPYREDVLRNSHNIGFPFWELDAPADCHRLGLDLVDELWLGSQFCNDVFSKAFSGPTSTMGLAVEPSGVDKAQARAALSRRLELGADAFVVLAMFDAYSYVERKNPLGMIRAFRAAFPDDASARLVIKTQHKSAITDDHQSEIWRSADRIVAADSRICIIDEAVDGDQVGAFMAAADCFLSLHRAEGFGLGMLEAMLEGVPVIATNYSGNTDFTTKDTAFLVSYTARHLAPNDYVYARPEHVWAEPNLQDAVEALRLVRRDSAKAKSIAGAAKRFAREHYSLSAIAEKYAARLNELL